MQSVPRLMPGQGVIVGVGTHRLPGRVRRAPTERTLAELGVSKVVTITSTYDHRIIQGAESGLFLKRVHELLLGEHGFYDDVFRALGVPYEAVKWRRDVNPIDREEAMLEKQMQVATLIRVHRVRGHLIADLDPLRWKEPNMHDELDPATYGLTIWDLDREFLTGGVGRHRAHARSATSSHVLRDAYCRTIGIEYMHIQDTDEQRWIQEQVEGVNVRARPATSSATSSSGSTRPRRSRSSSPPSTSARSASGSRAPSRRSRSSTRSSTAAADAGLDGAVLGMAHRGRLNVLANIVGKSYEPDLPGVRGLRRPDSVQGSGDVKYHLGADGQVRQPRRATTSRSSWPPTRATSRPSTRSCSAWSGPSRTRSTRRARSRCCRS